MYKSRYVFLGGLVLGLMLGLLGSSLLRMRRAGLSVNSTYTAPQLQFSPFVSKGSRSIEVYVDARGRVQDYRVLTGAHDLSPSEKNKLIFTTFHPATLMGRPTPGTAILSSPR